MAFNSETKTKTQNIIFGLIHKNPNLQDNHSRTVKILGVFIDNELTYTKLT